jgi:hypothetical protein
MGNHAAAALWAGRNDISAILALAHVLLAFSIVAPLYFMWSIRRSAK